MVKLTTADSSVNAALIRHKLEREGVVCFVVNENMANIFPTYQGFLGSGMMIMVDKDDYERALEILNRKPPHEVKPHCPFCGSENIADGSGRITLRFLLMMAVALFVLFSGPGGGMRKHCKDCHKDFPA
jgi:hypothetical protein